MGCSCDSLMTLCMDPAATPGLARFSISDKRGATSQACGYQMAEAATRSDCQLTESKQQRLTVDETRRVPLTRVTSVL